MLTEDSSAPPAFSPHLMLISERLRPEARATVEYFRREGVALKVISGHRPDTVASITPAAASRRAHRRTGGVLPDDPAELALPLPRRRSSASGARAAWRLLVSLEKTGCEQARER
jgi:cation-transporting ATPase E